MRKSGTLFLTAIVFMAGAFCYHTTEAYCSQEERIQTKSLPLILSLDGEKIATSMYLKCQIIDYNSMPYNKFIATEDSPYEQLFKKAVTGYRENCFETISELSYKKTNMTVSEKDEFNATVQGRVAGWNDLFTDKNILGDFDELKIYHKILIGQDIYIVFGTDEMGGEQPFRLMLDFKSDQSGIYLHNNITPTRSLVQSIVNHMISKPEDFDQAKRTFDFEIPFPGSSDKYKAYLQFNGNKYDINVFKEQIDPNDEVAKFFQRQFEIIREHPREALAELFAGRSREKFLAWIENAENSAIERGQKNYLDHHFDEMRKVERILRFIVDADPLYVVFYEKTSNPGNLNYQFVIRDPETGMLGFRNWYVYDFFRKWLDSPAVQEALHEFILVRAPVESRN